MPAPVASVSATSPGLGWTLPAISLEVRLLCAAVVTAGLLGALGALASSYRSPVPHPAERSPVPRAPTRPAAAALGWALA
jgi:hypothetical protein